MPANKQQLDLFGDLAHTPQNPVQQHLGNAAAVPPDTAQRSGVAKTSVLKAPANLPANVRWRTVATAKQTIGFMLRRSRRRTIGLTINDDGLLVTAPAWISVGQVDDAIRDKADWIVTKLKLRHERAEQLATAETQWQDGGTVPYLGKRIGLRLSAQLRNPYFSGNSAAPNEGDRLTLPLPAQADRERIRDATHVWLQQQARSLFEQRLYHFLAAEGLRIRRWRLSSAATRWGSCSSDGNIMLNWRLIHFDHNVIDYVIVHEIAHLRHMNHGPAFWQEVERLLPNFASLRDALRRHNPASLPLI